MCPAVPTEEEPMPAVTVDDVLVLPRIAEPDRATAPDPCAAMIVSRLSPALTATS